MTCRQTFHLLVSLSLLASSLAMTGDGCIAIPSIVKYLHKSDSSAKLHTAPAARLAPVQGVHLAIEGPDTVRVTWENPASPSAVPFNPQCLYGPSPSNLSIIAVGSSYSYTAGMFAKTLNSAVLDLIQIPCGQSANSPCVRTLWYSCGDKAFGWSQVFELQKQDATVPASPGPQIAVVGDMGVPHGLTTIAAIAKRMISHNAAGAGVQLLLHAGDISYADHYERKTDNNSWVWEDYMESLQLVAARVPYMTSPGNHEGQFNFAAYLNWLPMPARHSGSDSPFWFSFDYLGVHVLAFSTEHDFSPNSTQHRWIVQDLAKANQNREHVPWVVVMGHRPLYCSSIICWERCHDEAPRYRSYLEDVLNQQRVDVVIAGHNHQYERSYPVYQEKATQKNYTNPQAPVYIVNGAAGNPELNDPTFMPDVEWRANYQMTMSTGFLLMTPSATQLNFAYVMSDKNEIVDSFVIVRDRAWKNQQQNSNT